MTPDERRRAGDAIRQRMTDLGLSAADVAGKAGVSRSTVHRLISGQVWPRERTRERIIKVLHFPPGEIARRPLSSYTVAELARELCARLDNGDAP